MSTNFLENENKEGLIDTIQNSTKHNCWTFWHYYYNRHNSWETNQKEVVSFDTLDDFGILYSHVRLPSELHNGCDYSLFKKGIRPMWEDDANIHGGRWLINLEKKQRGNDLDMIWLNVQVSLIGGAVKNLDEICGAVVNVRAKGDKIAVWTSDAMHSTAVIEIGKQLKEILGIPENVTIGYQVHKNAMDNSISTSKYAYTV